MSGKQLEAMNEKQEKCLMHFKSTRLFSRVPVQPHHLKLPAKYNPNKEPMDGTKRLAKAEESVKMAKNQR